ncbi:hypothetical protein GCM10010261_62250 [Streptomyces pilosus]|uniref:Uncharacterized protein n=1 Tax=Streptomyces pilosus TaxID=28893 RepID=A0A918C6H2_9ACTN|nr:hypothetical protein GCM10010280_64980 [Streptomyces pilosus]GGV68533.1 hypothetical protein GCM10010261_62250 [Streptomyces pilosus]
MDVGGGQRVVVGGCFDEGPAAVGQGERGSELVAEAAAGGDRVGDGCSEGVFEAGAQGRGDVGLLQTAAGGRCRHRGSSQRSGKRVAGEGVRAEPDRESGLRSGGSAVSVLQLDAGRSSPHHAHSPVSSECIRSAREGAPPL